jgi:hypothetical protein
MIAYDRSLDGSSSGNGEPRHMYALHDSMS